LAYATHGAASRASAVGQLQSFLRSQSTTASVDGAPVANASDLWSAPSDDPAPWVTFWTYDTGVLADPGDSLTVTWQVTLSHPVPYRDPDLGILFDGPGDVYPADASCTITARSESRRTSSGSRSQSALTAATSLTTDSRASPKSICVCGSV
jgi:hypothetical protein